MSDALFVSLELNKKSYTQQPFCKSLNNACVKNCARYDVVTSLIEPKMTGFLTDYSDAQIVAILIGGCLATAAVICMATCGIMSGLKGTRRKSGMGNGGQGSGSSGGGAGGLIIKEQSQSVLRGDHPIAFVLPTVPFSEASEVSDLDGLGTGYSSSTSISIPG